MSWDDYLSYLSSRWLKRFVSDQHEAPTEEIRSEAKEPWSQWWFGVVPMALKLLFYGQFRRLSR